jgi:hypothetical protein
MDQSDLLQLVEDPDCLVLRLPGSFLTQNPPQPGEFHAGAPRLRSILRLGQIGNFSMRLV